MKTEKTLSIVVPVYNEETNVTPFYEAMVPVLESIGMDAELVFVDDGSRDRTVEILRSLAEKDNRVKFIRFSRNFGSHAALLAGFRFASGDAVVMISVDLQDPPELIAELVRKWQEGYQVVWAVREGRDDPFMKKLYATVFYNLFRKIALPEYPKTGMDFGLFDRCVVDNLKQFHELNHFITGMIVWLGFNQGEVPYFRRARHSGVSKFPIGRRIKYALDAIISFSYVPIRFISYIGLIISFLSFLYAGVLIIGRLLFGMGGIGWPSVMVTVLFLGGVQLITLGVIGEYVWRGTEQVKGRPQYIVRDSYGFTGGCRGDLREKITEEGNRP